MPLYRGFGKKPLKPASIPPAEQTRRISRPSPANKSCTESAPAPMPSNPAISPNRTGSTSPAADQTRRIARDDCLSSRSSRLGVSSDLTAEKTVTDTAALTISPPANEQGITPAELVVGWLAIIAGPGRSALLTLGYGINDIGRGTGARVRLDYGDPRIAIENQAAITYSTRSRRFYLQAVAADVILNNQLVTTTIELTGGEILQMGQTQLRFIPLCGQDFDWLGDDD